MDCVIQRSSSSGLGSYGAIFNYQGGGGGWTGKMIYYTSYLQYFIFHTFCRKQNI